MLQKKYRSLYSTSVGGGLRLWYEYGTKLNQSSLDAHVEAEQYSVILLHIARRYFHGNLWGRDTT